MGWFSKIKKGVKKAGRGIGKVGKKIGRGVKKGVKTVGRGVKKGVKGVGKGIKGAVKIGGKIGKGIAKGVKKGVMFGVSIVGNVALLPLAPMIPAMRRAVKKKGIKPKRSLLGLVKQFRKYVLAKQHYDCYDGSRFDLDRYRKNYLDPISIGILVKLVMSYFNRLKQKKASGEELTNEEEKTLDLVEKGEQAVISGATDEAEFQIGKFINKYKIPIGLTVVSLITTVIIVVARGSKKSN